ncbi:MAG TPA: DUF3631 domain-containing protein [Xanthobacteraceae bacterium]|nr:DUF3631 domain-containing protein [Xanthobacteraceae bacterium]
MMTIDFEEINAAALRSGRALVQDLIPGGKFRSLEYVVRNPKRADQHAGSFSINYRSGVWKDFATDDGGSDPISLVAYVRNCSQGDAARWLADWLGVPVSKPNGRAVNTVVVSATAPNNTRPAKTLIVPVPADAPSQPIAHPMIGKPAAQWAYLDAAGATLGYVLRFDRNGTKEFRPLTLWRSDSDGTVSWCWELWPNKRPLYGLRRLAERPSAPVVICEGEKAADAATSLLSDFVAVTSPNGSKSAAKADWLPLKGRTVIVWPDADQAGRDYAHDVANLATDANAFSVSILVPPTDVPAGWDAADALASGWDQSRAEAFIRTAIPPAAGTPTKSETVGKDGDATGSEPDVEIEIQRLASLSEIQYERERKAAAERLEMRATVLDGAVKAARPKDSKGQGRTFELSDIEPWPDSVNGADLLDEISNAILRHVVMTPDSAGTLALWAAHTHCFECFVITPRAALTSPEKGCGKTTTLDVLERLVARPLPTSNATVAAIFRVIESTKPTVLIDEADTFLKENNELRGILNTGHRRGGQVLRTVGDDHEPRVFSTWAPVAIAMIGHLPDTLSDRSVIVRLRRRKLSETIQSFREDRCEQLAVLARKAARWTRDYKHVLTAADPDMGDLINRMADNWQPLFAIADAAGGKWPARVREIASAAVAIMNDESTAAVLFGDIKWIYDGCPEKEENGKVALTASSADRMPSAQLVEHLIKIEGRPWVEWKDGKPITPNRLARLLGKFEILSGSIRMPDGKTPKGYYRSAFEDAFARYIPFSCPQNATPPQPNNDGHCGGLQNATQEQAVALSKTPQPNNDGHCGAVALSNAWPTRMGAIDL